MRSPSCAGSDRVAGWPLAVAGLLGLGLLHAAVIAAQSASRGVDESLLAVAGFVAIEFILLLPLLPVAGSQARRWLSSADHRALRLVMHLAVALTVVAAYRGAVLSVALFVELGEVPLRHLEVWWHHVGPWQLQADLLAYGGAGGALALLPAREKTGPREVSARTEEGAGSVDGGNRAAGTPTGAVGRVPGRLTVRAGGAVHVVPIEEIRWIEGAGTYVRIHVASRSYLLRDTLDSLTDRLETSGFVRVHRSAILNLRHLDLLEPAPRGRWTARLNDGMSVRVSASRAERLANALGDTLER